MTEVAQRVKRAPETASGRRRSRFRAPLAVARARLRAHPGRALLVALGVTAATAMLTAAFGASVIARDRAVERALAALPVSDRSFRVDAFGLPAGTSYAQADRRVSAGLSRLASGTPLRGTFFRELRIHGRLVQLAGIDGIGRLVHLRSGRLPQTCVPARCEVLEIGGGTIRRLDEGEIHIVRVGVADIPGKAAFGESIDTEQEGGDSPTLLVAAGARSFDRLPAFDGIYRLYTWIAPIAPDDLHVWQIDRVLEQETAVQTELARAGDLYRLSGPDVALTDARSQGRVAAQRMLLIGGEASALLLGFAAITALGLRRGLANERRRLLQRGATRLQVLVSALGELVATTFAGAAAGFVCGVAVVTVAAGAAGLPRVTILGHSVLTTTAALALAGLWLAATGAAFAAARARESHTRGWRLGPVDVAAVGAAGAIALGLSRGGLDAQDLASGGSRWLLLALPLLVSFVAAVAAVRLLGPLARLAERTARGGSVVVRLALLSLSRAPLRTTATTAFLLVSLGLGFFAASWRATIERGDREQAAFAVPLDFTLTEGSRLVRPLDAAPLSRYDAIARGVRAYPILRRSADVAGVGTSVLSPSVLGLPPAALAALHWRSDFAPGGPAELARRLSAGGQVVPRGLALPDRARSVSLDVRLTGVPVHLDLVVRDAHGASSSVFLGERPRGSWRLSARLPPSARQIAGLEVSLANAEQLGATHRQTGAELSTVAAGDAAIGPLRASLADGSSVRVTGWQGFVPRAGMSVRHGSETRLSYAFTEGQTALLRLPQPTDGRPLRVVASSDVARSAGPGGQLVLDFQGVRIRAQVVGVARRFPAAEQQAEGFVIADESWLATALDADAPGTAVTDELWLTVPRDSDRAVSRALRRPPFSSLVVSSRRSLQDALSADPLARGLTLSLAAAALVALALAVLGFWVAILSELRDERGELFDLEAQGVAPATLRRRLRLRSGGVVAVGILGGCALGLVLSQLVVAVVRVSGTTSPPDPPLRLDAAWPLVAAGLAAVTLSLALVVELAARRAFRGDTPERASWSLE